MSPDMQAKSELSSQSSPGLQAWLWTVRGNIENNQGEDWDSLNTGRRICATFIVSLGENRSGLDLVLLM